MASCPRALQGHWLNPAGITTPWFGSVPDSQAPECLFYLSISVRTDKAASLDGRGVSPLLEGLGPRGQPLGPPPYPWNVCSGQCQMPTVNTGRGDLGTQSLRQGRSAGWERLAEGRGLHHHRRHGSGRKPWGSRK